MKRTTFPLVAVFLVIMAAVFYVSSAISNLPLSAWNEGRSKQRIVDYWNESSFSSGR